MKYLTALGNLSNKSNSLAYSRPGAGKTSFGLQHPYPVIVDPAEQGYLTVLEGWPDVPVLEIESLEDIEDVVYEPEDVMACFIKHHPSWDNYPYGSFIFENVNLVQETILGKASKIDPETKKVLKPAEGIMASPNARDNREVPGPKDFNQLSRKTKDLFRGIRNMPYHTLVTVHAGLSETEESPKGIGVNESLKTYEGFPEVYGKLRYYLGGLCDFYFFLERTSIGNNLRYTAYTRPHKKYEGRSKIAKKLPVSIDWTDKSLFDIIMSQLNKALKEAKEKSIYA